MGRVVDPTAHGQVVARSHKLIESCRGRRRACFWTGLQLDFSRREIDSRFDRRH
jgi:hypothetical protein